ncbi:hypothetical protein BH24ACT5_BH24ACT5_25460 [soil metagenome]
MTAARSRFLRRPAALAIGVIALAACGPGGDTASGTGAVATTTPAASPTDDAGAAADVAAAPASTNSGAVAAAFGQTFASGEPLGDATFDGATLFGVDAVLWFCAPWCTVCRAEGPEVADVAARYADRLQIVGVAGRGEVADMDEFVADTGTGGLTHVADLDGSIWSAFGVFAQPAFAFINDDGSVETFVGGLGEDALVERIDELLAD